MNVARFLVVPQTLYRIQSKLPVRLRDFESQQALKRTSFDLKTHNNVIINGSSQKTVVLPTKLNTFEGPNGMSLRPNSENMRRIANEFKGLATVYTLQVGLQLPKHFVLLHEHTDHYSLQTSEPCTLDELNQRMTNFLQSLPSQTLEEFKASINDEDDQDN